MKKAIILCALLLLFGLVGCSDNVPPGQEVPYETAGLTNVETPAPERLELSAERELQIRENFLVWLHNAGRDCVELDYVKVTRYFGTFDGREAVFMLANVDDTFGSAEEKVAGYDFVFGSSGWAGEHEAVARGGVHIWLHDDGDWMCFCVGYERGYLTAEDIGLIWERYMGNMGE